MKKIVQQVIVFFLATAIIGCATLKQDQPKEYAYLAPVIKKDVLWGHDEWDQFISKLSDRHLSELALEWGVLDENSKGINRSWRGELKVLSVGDPLVALNGKGGRHKVMYELRRELISSAYRVPWFERDVKWHEIVNLACKNVALSDCNNMSSYDAESAVLSKIFEKSWDGLTPAQRKQVIDKATLPGFSDKDKSSIIAMSGSSALALLRTSVAISGFSFYTGMSSMIAATANVIGVTVPFGVYTATSSLVGTLTGPVGWSVSAVATALVLYDALKPDVAKTAKMIISLHLIKARVLEDAR